VQDAAPDAIAADAPLLTDAVSCSDLAQPPELGSPLWCAQSCCEHVPTAIAICMDGKWQCPPQTLSCCGPHECGRPMSDDALCFQGGPDGGS
jgi:hypothetical protein